MEDDLPDLPYLQRASGKNLIKSPNDLLSMDYLQDEEIAQFDLEVSQFCSILATNLTRRCSRAILQTRATNLAERKV